MSDQRDGGDEEEVKVEEAGTEEQQPELPHWTQEPPWVETPFGD